MNSYRNQTTQNPFRLTPHDICTAVFSVNNYLSWDNMPTRSQLIADAVKWITDKKELYLCTSPENKNKINRLLALQHNGTIPEQLEALQDFHQSFLNNPYIFEKCFDADSASPWITSREISCYLVVFDDIVLPFGVIEAIQGADQMRRLIRIFLENRINSFHSVLSDNINTCQEYIKTDKEERRKKCKLSFQMFTTILFLIPALMFLLSHLIFGVDWLAIPDISKQCTNLFQAIGFLTEKSYGITHNSYVNTVFLALSLFWFFYLLGLLPAFSGTLRTLHTYRERISLYATCKQLCKHLTRLQDEKESLIQFVLQNEKDLDMIQVQSQAENLLKKLERKLNQNTPPLFTTRKRKLPGVFGLISLLIFSLSTGFCNFYPHAVSEKVNLLAREITLRIDQQQLYATKKYTVAQPMPVYTKATTESLVLYEVTPGEWFWITEISPENPEIKKIKLFTQFGHLEGWVFQPAMVEYAPEANSTLTPLPIADANASSYGHGKATNLYDGKSYTMWGEDGVNGGVGEFVDLIFAESAPISVLMIQSGNCYSDWKFTISSRPIAFTLEFYQDDIMLSFVSAKIDDSQKKQYIHLNQPITANKVRFVIDEVVEGTMHKKSYLTELCAYR